MPRGFGGKGEGGGLEYLGGIDRIHPTSLHSWLIEPIRPSISQQKFRELPNEVANFLIGSEAISRKVPTPSFNFSLVLFPALCYSISSCPYRQDLLGSGRRRYGTKTTDDYCSLKANPQCFARKSKDIYTLSKTQSSLLHNSFRLNAILMRVEIHFQFLSSCNTSGVFCAF